MFKISNIEIRMNTVNKILKFLKLDVLNDEEKQAIYEIAKSIKKKVGSILGEHVIPKLIKRGLM